MSTCTLASLGCQLNLACRVEPCGSGFRCMTSREHCGFGLSRQFNAKVCESHRGTRNSRSVLVRADTGSVEAAPDKWLKSLPDKKAALYSHSLPCIEAWLKSLGFVQSKEERAVWVIERPDWHAQLSLDTTELRIRYLKSGPGNLERDVERKFSYALCREDLENAILGGP